MFLIFFDNEDNFRETSSFLIKLLLTAFDSEELIKLKDLSKSILFLDIRISLKLLMFVLILDKI